MDTGRIHPRLNEDRFATLDAVTAALREAG
jgi:hypothetical protein